MSRTAAKAATTFPDIVSAMEDSRLLGSMFGGPSWSNWRAVIRGAFALSMTEAEVEFFRSVTDREPPTRRMKELTVVAGRRSGKDSVAAAIAAYTAAVFRPSGRIRPGERPLVMLLGADRAQARAQLSYIKGLFNEIAPFKAIITRETQDTLELSSGVDIVLQTADHRSARGRSVLLAVCTETAFWPASENSANPDVETFRAIQPSLATLDGESMVILISSAYKRSGLLYDRWKRFYGVDDPNTLIVHAKTRDLNPLISQEVIAAAFADDPESAKAEWDSLWRDDLAGFVTLQEIEAIVDRGIAARPRVNGVQYSAWLDASSGAGKDSFCASIGHREGDNCVIDRIIEIRPPFSPPSAVALIAGELANFGIRRATADRWGLAFVASEFERHQIALEYSDKNSSEIFRQALPIIRSGRSRLPDHDRMKNQFVNLERRILPGGGERIGHPERGGHHDDICVVVSGCLVALAAPLTGPESTLEYYRRLVEEPNRYNTDMDDFRASGPEFGFSFSDEPLIRVTLPPGPIAAEGVAYAPRAGRLIARRIGTDAIVEVGRADAIDLLKGNKAWSAANADLARELLGESDT